MRRAAGLVARVLLRVIVAGGVVIAVAFAIRPTLIGTSRAMKSRMEDTNTLRHMAKLVADTGRIPMRDGTFDPYAFVRGGNIVPEQYKLFCSARSDTGPTPAEIEGDDYTNFPWERYRGDGKLTDPPFPLLWERKPDKEGKLLVALSDGSVEYREPR